MTKQEEIYAMLDTEQCKHGVGALFSMAKSLASEKKGACKDCRAWSPRGGEQGFCRRSPHRCKANEGCGDFERREENESISN